VALVRANYPELNEEEAAARVEFVTVLSEGSAFRTITEDVASPVLLESLYREVLKKLFPRMTERGFG